MTERAELHLQYDAAVGEHREACLRLTALRPAFDAAVLAVYEAENRRCEAWQKLRDHGLFALGEEACKTEDGE